MKPLCLLLATAAFSACAAYADGAPADAGLLIQGRVVAVDAANRVLTLQVANQLSSRAGSGNVDIAWSDTTVFARSSSPNPDGAATPIALGAGPSQPLSLTAGPSTPIALTPTHAVSVDAPASLLPRVSEWVSLRAEGDAASGLRAVMVTAGQPALAVSPLGIAPSVQPSQPRAR